MYIWNMSRCRICGKIELHRDRFCKCCSSGENGSKHSMLSKSIAYNVISCKQIHRNTQKNQNRRFYYKILLPSSKLTKIPRKSSHRCARLTCITCINCITYITFLNELRMVFLYWIRLKMDQKGHIIDQKGLKCIKCMKKDKNWSFQT